MNKVESNKKLPIKKGSFKRLFGYILKNYKIQFIFVIFCILASTFINVIGSLFIGKLIDNYIEPLLLEQNPVFTGLLKAIVTLAFLYLTGIIFNYLYNRIMVVIAQGILKDIRNDMFKNMQKFPIKYFDTHSHGDIMSYFTNDTDTLREMLGKGLPQFISSFITIILTFCAMIYISGILTLFTVFTITIILIISRKMATTSSKYFINQQKYLGKVNGFIEEMINGQKVIKVFCHEDKSKEDFDKLNNELFGNMYKANKYANILMPLTANLGNLQYVLVAIVGGLLSIKTTLTVGNIASFLQLINSFNSSVSQIMQHFNSIIMALAGASRIFEFLDEKEEEDDGYVTLVNAKKVDNNLVEVKEHTGLWAWKHLHHDGRLEYIELKGNIEFSNVDFSYQPNNKILHDISLYAKPGQKIAFVGATGAGKTTITNLLNRFYDIEDGKIRYDGININKIKKSDLRKSLGMVLQDTNLFTGTIKENIKYGNFNATDEEVIKASKIANAHDFIARLPNGYDTKITANGASLSQGQRQLIAIARAAINDPPVMILDEATSSIDTRTEKIVQDGMDKLMEGRTVLVIAHRLSTVRNSKAIMVLDHGKIIERGNHDELIEQKGQYYQLYTGAFELE